MVHIEDNKENNLEKTSDEEKKNIERKLNQILE